ncbi:MAG: OadG family protein [bacterium]|nr:OadG family protein [bacterium]
MVVEGLKLMVLGMGVVYIFLALLVVIMHINARLLRGVTERELQAPADPRAAKRKQEKHIKAKAHTDEKQRVVAVIAAAVAAHRTKQTKQQ